MIGILYVCTGRYTMFWKDFYISAEKYFLTSEDKTYFVFTDAAEIYGETNNNVKKIHQKNLGWPYNTLLRFQIFLAAEDKLSKCDYLFFLNANTQILAPVENEILPGEEHDGLIGVIHPNFWDKGTDSFPYERNSESAAYIAHGSGQHYFMGAFNGGQSAPFLQLIKTSQRNTEKDLGKGIITIWWDESHLNHYLLKRNPLVLSPSYLYPEDYQIPFEPKILIIDKMKHGGHDFLRGLTETSYP